MRSFNQVVGPAIVLDTGLLIEFLTGTKAGSIIEKMIFKNPFITAILINPITLIEIYYLIRRKSTQERAKEEIIKIKKLARVVQLEEYLEIIGELKATTSISLADVASIALAEYQDVKVLFKHETELDDQLAQYSSETFAARIIFVDDFPFFTQSGEDLEGE